MKNRKLVLLSDTHNKHNQVDLDIKNISNLEDSIIIHAGDFTSMGFVHEVDNFLTWYSSIPAAFRILIAGNHEVYFEKIGEEERKKTMAKYPNIIYLENSGVEIDGINIFGIPQQPEFYNWAFNIPRGAAIKKYWDAIPENTNILVTHGPLLGYGDLVNNRYQHEEHVGCEDLLNRVNELKELKLVVNGHIHSGSGIYNHNGIQIINASVLNEDYNYQYPPKVIDYEY